MWRCHSSWGGVSPDRHHIAGHFGPSVRTVFWTEICSWIVFKWHGAVLRLPGRLRNRKTDIWNGPSSVKRLLWRKRVLIQSLKGGGGQLEFLTDRFSGNQGTRQCLLDFRMTTWRPCLRVIKQGVLLLTSPEPQTLDQQFAARVLLDSNPFGSNWHDGSFAIPSNPETTENQPFEQLLQQLDPTQRCRLQVKKQPFSGILSSHNANGCGMVVGRLKALRLGVQIKSNSF